MNFYEPEAYGRFVCIGGACPDTCCAAWEVVVDPASAQRYRTVPGELGDKLRLVMEPDGEDTVFRLQNGRCPFLDQNNLCELICGLGEEILCITCAKFPRFTHAFGGTTERGLSLSCPEAARLLLDAQEPMAFVQKTAPGLPEPNELNPQLYMALRKARQELLTALQDRSVPVLRRAQGLWSAVEAAARKIRGHRYGQIPEASRKAFADASSLPAVDRACWQKLDFLGDVLPKKLACLTEDDTAQALLTRMPEAEIMLEHFLVYLVFRYYLLSAYDRRPDEQGRLMQHLFSMACALAAHRAAEEPGISKKELREIISLCCKEVEHSSENPAILSRAEQG